MKAKHNSDLVSDSLLYLSTCMAYNCNPPYIFFFFFELIIFVNNPTHDSTWTITANHQPPSITGHCCTLNASVIYRFLHHFPGFLICIVFLDLRNLEGDLQVGGWGILEGIRGFVGDVRWVPKVRWWW
ncbi:hypothetical protein Hanom_Chr12g01071861 [Helianthus anomalus]